MTKAEFLGLLRDGKVPAADVRAALAQVPESEFVPFNAQHPTEPNNDWDTNYFREQVSIAERDNFARERCEHLIAYKQKLQDMGVEGFALPKADTSSASSQKPAENPTADDELEALLRSAPRRLMGYQPSSNMQKHIEAGNIASVRATLAAELTNNRLDKEYLIQSMLYVYQKLPTAFESYASSKFHPLFDINKQIWEPDYFDQQTSYLSRNFALERVHHIINVRDYLRQQGHASFRKIEPASQQSGASGSKAQNHEKHTSCRCSAFKVAAALIGSGALLALIIALLFKEK